MRRCSWCSPSSRRRRSGCCCKAEFLAITLVLVYVGAVMVLFLFVVMMLDINVDSLRQGFWKHFPLAGVGALIALEMAAVLMGGFRLAEAPTRRRQIGAQLQHQALSSASCCIPSTCIRWKSRQ
jgi:NADH:ubiquinone oxidoreductase subunit 6 (subunit J)